MLTAMAGSKTAETTGQPQAPVRRERQLVERFIRGDDSAFDEIVAAYQGRVAGLAYRLLGWPGDVEDVVQEVFLAVFRNLGKFRGDCEFETWLTTITVNKCRSWRRKHLLKLKLLKYVSSQKPPAGPRADQDVMNRETFDRIRRTLQSLPGVYREVIVLHYLEEMPIGEMAEVLNLKRNAVDVRLSRARAQLKVELADLIEDK